jgi:hypothetical protein
MERPRRPLLTLITQIKFYAVRETRKPSDPILGTKSIRAVIRYGSVSFGMYSKWVWIDPAIHKYLEFFAKSDYSGEVVFSGNKFTSLNLFCSLHSEFHFY